ncbi:MAG: tripartite tricarboxylate transporter substrate binding protein [Spirochaetia bacterium]|nr:tripartite tricarboxylate transporter substrate binding protein [Spirochaetia bacterium]
MQVFGMNLRRYSMALLVLALIMGFTANVFATGAPEQETATTGKIDFPTRPVTFIVGWDAGGGSDIVSRILCAEAEKFLGQPITIVNMPGGSGTRSYTEIANAKPDGYTIGNTTGTISTHVFAGNLNFGHEAFVPIMTMNDDPGAIWVKQDAPWQTLDDLIKDLKANPESITIASSNPASITRFGTIMLEQVAGVRFRIASQAGGESAGPTLVAGGHVDAAQAAPVTAKALYEGGKIRSLGVMADQRVPAFPDIPTYKEQGYDASIGNLRQIIAPKDTPQEIVDILYEAFRKAANSETYVKFMNESGSTPLDWDYKKSREFLIQQDKDFSEILKSIGQYVEPVGRAQ